MILIFDTETTGKADFKKPATDPCQPHLVQLAALLCDDDGNDRAMFSLVVNPGVPIPEGATKVHGITDEIAADLGVLPVTACCMWRHLLRRAETVVAHNMEFDWLVMSANFVRNDLTVPKRLGHEPMLDRFCTMKASTAHCRLPGRYGDYKWPSLEEATQHFFKESVVGAHDALGDARAAKRIFFKLREMEGVPT